MAHQEAGIQNTSGYKSDDEESNKMSYAGAVQGNLPDMSTPLATRQTEMVPAIGPGEMYTSTATGLGAEDAKLSDSSLNTIIQARKLRSNTAQKSELKDIQHKYTVAKLRIINANKKVNQLKGYEKSDKFLLENLLEMFARDWKEFDDLSQLLISIHNKKGDFESEKEIRDSIRYKEEMKNNVQYSLQIRIQMLRENEQTRKELPKHRSTGMFQPNVLEVISQQQEKSQPKRYTKAYDRFDPSRELTMDLDFTKRNSDLSQGARQDRCSNKGYRSDNDTRKYKKSNRMYTMDKRIPNSYKAKAEAKRRSGNKVNRQPDLVWNKYRDIRPEVSEEESDDPEEFIQDFGSDRVYDSEEDYGRDGVFQEQYADRRPGDYRQRSQTMRKVLDKRYDALPKPWNVKVYKTNPAETHDLSKIKTAFKSLTFSGKSTDYSIWRSNFITCIHKRPFGDEEKCLILHELLEGEAMKAKARIPISWYGYTQIIANLESMFGSRIRDISKLIAELSVKKVTSIEDTAGIRRILDSLQQLRYTFYELGREDSFDDMVLYSQTLRLIPRQFQEAFEEQMQRKGRDLDDRDTSALMSWLEKRYRIMKSLDEATAVKESQQQTTYKQFRGQQRKRGGATAFQAAMYEFEEANAMAFQIEETQVPKCTICSIKHFFVDCPKFIEMSPQQRLEIIRKCNLCVRCLESGHILTKCPNQDFKCIQCGRPHHSMLHGAVWQNRPTKSTTLLANTGIQSEESEDGEDMSDNILDVQKLAVCNISNIGSYISSLRFVALKVQVPGSDISFKCNAVLDDGASFNCINADFAKKIGFAGIKTPFGVTGFNGRTTWYNSIEGELKLLSLPPADEYTAKATFRSFPNPVGKISAIDWNKMKEKFDHMRFLDFSPVDEDQPIQLILGHKDVHLISALSADIEGQPDEPSARLTRWGYTGCGTLTTVSTQQCMYTMGTVLLAANSLKLTEVAMNKLDRIKDQYVSTSAYSEVDLALDQFSELLWQDVDPPVTKIPYTTEEALAVKHMNDTRKIENNKYTLGTLWKSRDRKPDLPDNYYVVYKRQLASYNRMQQKDHNLDEYNDVFVQWEKEKFIEDVPKNEGTTGYYIPHFPVVKKDRLTTKIRPVMDCRAECGGKSLNSQILAGPNIFTDLRHVLMHFRKQLFAFSGDVKNMFLNIGLQESDRRYHRFVWIQQEQIRLMQFAAFLFGSKCSPLIAVGSAKHNAEKYQDVYTKAAQVVLHMTLMDDSLGSYETEQEVIEVIQELVQLYAKMGMKIRKFASNSAEVMKSIPIEDRSSQVDLTELFKDDSGLQIKALGLTWDCSLDKLSFRLTENFGIKDNIPVTKRIILSHLMKVFDPLGLIAPVVLPCKVIFQALWLLRTSWDEPILECSYTQKFRLWMQQITDIKDLSLKRSWVTQPGMNTRTFHVFVDASEYAYGIVVYVVSANDEGKKETALVYAKSKLNPIKPLTVPVLELTAAVKGFRMAEFTAEAFGVELAEFRFWSDSKCVHDWLHTPAHTLPRGTRNKVAFLQTYTQPDQWWFVPSNLNPADLASRGCSVKDLIDHNLWWTGPPFLMQESSYPPQFKRERWIPPQTESALVIKEDITPPIGNVEFFQRFSNWRRMLTTIVIALRWRSRALNKIANSGPWSDEELELAENKLWIILQSAYFSEDIHRLRTGLLSKQTSIRTLDPIMDQHGIMRVGGRLGFSSTLTFDEIHPIIVPTNSHVTIVLIRYYHERVFNHMAGYATTLQALRRKYWILKGTKRIRQVISRCIPCKTINLRARYQKMAQIPEFRIQQHVKNPLIFNVMGIDLAGPFMVTSDQAKSVVYKCWIVLFVCMLSRAVHTEIVTAISTDELKNAFERFLARKPRPTRIISDRGTNFIGLANQLKELLLFNDEKLRQLYPDIHWDFNIPGAPHTGGVYERMIAALKRALHLVLHKKSITEKEFTQSVLQAEFIINSRPIAQVSTDSKDMEAITPNDMIIGKLNGPLTIPKTDSWKVSKRWEFIQNNNEEIWKKFQQEIRARFLIMPKWWRKRNLLVPGQLVIIIEKSSLVNSWAKGRILEVYTSNGVQRSAKVLSGDKTSVKPIHLLIPLLEDEVAY